jgi:type IV pilus assembly protein PilN
MMHMTTSIRINLLPWRAQAQLARRKNFGYLLSAGVIGALSMLGLWHVGIAHQLDQQAERNALLERHIILLAAPSQAAEKLRGQKQRLLAQWEMFKQQQGARWWPARFFVELAQTMPQGVLLFHIQHSGEQITLQGKAGSGVQIARLASAIEQSSCLTHPVVSEMKANSQGFYRHDFTLTAQVKAG